MLMKYSIKNGVADNFVWQHNEPKAQAGRGNTMKILCREQKTKKQ